MRLHSLFFVLTLAFTVPGTAAEAPSSSFTGAGSSAAKPVYAAWATAFAADRGIRLDYDPAGSGAGTRKLLAREVDFGATDLVPTAEALQGQDVVVIPTAVSGAVPVVNLPGVPAGALRLDGRTLADIFGGRILRWNDPAIRGLNRGLPLPDAPIRVVARSDSSGTTWNFADYLAKVSPEWRARFGVATAFKWGEGVATAKGNDGVATTVARSSGSIGYVDYNYVVRYDLNPVSLRNREGVYVAAGLESFAAALAASPWPRSGDFSATLTDQPGSRSWPITMGTFVLVPRRGGDAPGVRRAVEFFSWAFLHGDELVKTSYFVRLPDAVQAKAFRALASVTDTAGNSVGFAGLAR